MKVERPRARSSAAPTRLNSLSTMPICARFRRHERAHLRQDRDQRVLAQEGRFARHVRAGDEPDAGPCSSATDRNRWARSGCASRRASAASTTGWRPRRICEGEAVVDHGAHMALARRASSASAVATSSARQRIGDGASAARWRPRVAASSLEQIALDGERLIGGLRNPRLRASRVRRW